jgi:type IV pilus assembly protein PilY1
MAVYHKISVKNRGGKDKLLLAALAATTSAFSALLWSQTAEDFTAAPPLLQSAAPARVMLLLSNDHQLYFKAYTDYTDLDGDGELDTTYNDAFDYYGYFHSGLCYDYVNSRFEPAGAVTSGHQCGGNWSGNFLNWASMTRMDIVRRVFYGGKRSVDTTDETVLQRTYLPNDAHSFVKVYDGDVSSYTPYDYDTISLCNTTLATGLSKDVDESVSPPLMRIAEGNFPLWAVTERAQCVYQGETTASGEVDRPASGEELFVRVQSCVEGLDANVASGTGSDDYCRAYGDTPVYKPIGVLQENSEDGSIQFGLMSGTHGQKMSGGVLRRNITALAGNNDPANDEVDLATGRFRYLNGSGFSGGIIQTLDSMRIAAWDYDSDYTYADCDTPGVNVATYKANATGNRSCKDWGNPLAEMYMEALRYFAANGNGPIEQFSTDDDSNYLKGMVSEAWRDPLSTEEPCARCSIIVMSTGLNSFDADELDAVSGLPGIASVDDINSKTDAIGVNEGLFGSYAIVGNVDGNANDNSCTPKEIGSFSDILGICPQMPSLEGSYGLAGLASYAQTTDLRPGSALPDIQNIDTYTIALAETLPSFSFQTQSGETIGVVPACQALFTGAGDWSECSIVNATLVEKTEFYTRLDIAWENSLWGYDYDLDGLATIEVCTATGNAAPTECQYEGARPVAELDNYKEWLTTAATSEVQVRVSVPQAYAESALRLGFIVAGTTNDTSYLDAVRAGGSNYTCLLPGSCDDTAKAEMVWAAPRLLTAGTSQAEFLETPLWYAAKYGNFAGSDSKDVPTVSEEWDIMDLDGNPNPDGVPDAYFPVRNPGQLATRLNNIVTLIQKQAASGTSVAVTLERRDGVGATFQAYYFPSYKKPGANLNEVNWVGGLHALFLDDDLNLREDSNQDGVLNPSDSVINLFYDGENTVVQRLNADGSVAATVPFTSIEPIWDAKDWLAGLSDTQVVNQRPYASSVGRHIFTWMDQPEADGTGPDGKVDANEVVDFVPAEFASDGRYRILGVEEAEAASLVDYIRGSDEQPNKRSRTVNFEGDSSFSVWRLGDIVHSSPVIVGRPGDGYDIDYRDGSYTEFRNRYLDRRQVVYAGANDGMLHAFNAGFYQQGSSSFATAAKDPVTGEDLVGYDLGAEMWAYVPRNLLPHLRWLAENNYQHVFYVDGEPRVYDVNIFTPDATHPGGWGTILVVGFRFGGGAISLDLDGDGANDFTSRSAYAILDITDPEQPPKLLAEITDPRLGYTTVVPTLVTGRAEDLTTGLFNADEDAWYLVFGSGPAGIDAATRRDALTRGVSHQNAHLFIYDLVAREFVDLDATTDGMQTGLDTGVANSFLGDPTAVDWDRSYIDDIVYFGLVEGLDPANPGGRLNRLVFSMPFTAGSAPAISLSGSPVNTLLNPGMPFQGAPVTFRDLGANREWVLAGTGRYLTAVDNVTNYASRFYGLLEPLNDSGDFSYATIAESSLADTTDLVVLDNNTVYDANTSLTPATVRASGANASVGNFSDLMTVTKEAGGWFNELGPLTIRLDSDGAPAKSTESRNYNGAIAISSGVGFVKYAPDQSVCLPSGFSTLRFVDSRTGTASRNIFFEAVLAQDSFLSITGDAELLSAESETMQGAISKLTLVRTNDGSAVGSSDNYGGIQFDKIGALPPLSRRQSWRELPIYLEAQ